MEEGTNSDVLYRYEEFTTDTGSLYIHCCLLAVVRRTKCGWRLSNGRFVLEKARCHYACPTREEAWESYRCRKTIQAKRVQYQVAVATAALRLVKEHTQAPVSPLVGQVWLTESDVL